MTHLNVPVGNIVNLVTMQLNNNNTAALFYYDRQPGSEFNVPQGYSFVVTDIIVNPENSKPILPDQYYLVVVTIDGGRSFTVRCNGYTAHYPLSGGLTIPPSKGHCDPIIKLNARNTTFSTGPVEVQLLGYFIKGVALERGKEFTI